MKKIISGLVMLILILISQYALAQEKPQAMIVFDASGSMWGQIDGEAKITIAKKALNKVVSNWDANVDLGLIAYGHRKKGDCSDIQTLVPIGQVDKKGMISKVQKIKPKGKTPISQSIKKAAEALKYTEEKATVILISDGKETCNADPCATAKALENEGIDFIAHVIGFNVDKQTDKQLKCIADVTGGEYFSAKNASSLNDAMGKIAKKVQKVEPEPKAPIVKKLKYNLEITASELGSNKWVKAYHRIYPMINDEKQNQIEACYSHKKESCLEQLPVGKYSLHSTYNKFKQDTHFELKADELTKLHVVMGQTGKVEITASESEGSKWVEAFHRIYPMIDGEKQDQIETCYSHKKESCLEQLPVGKYSLHSTYNKFKQDIRFELKPGELTKVHVVMGQTGKVEITASESEGSKWVEAYHRIYPIVDGEKQDQIEGCSSYKKESCLKQLPVGKYSIHSTFNKFKQDPRFELKAGELTKVHIVMGQTGKVEITASESEGSKWVKAYHRIYPIVDGEKQDQIEGCFSYKKESCLKQLPVGKYSLHSSYKDFKKDTPFEIKSGETTRLSVIFTQFIIDAKCADMSAKISYEVYASNGQMIFDKKAICSDKVQLSIDNGDYTLEASVGSNTKSKKFTLGTGHPNTLTIDMLVTPAAKAKEDSHEDLIKADSPSEPQSNSKPTSSPTSSKEKNSKISGIPITTEKTPDKMLEAFKQSIIVSLPMIKQTQQCYQQADNLDQAKNCENLEEKAMLKAQAVIKKIAGVKTQPKPLSKHSEWNNQIKTSTLAGTAKDIIKMKLSIICIDKVNSFSQLATCIANNTK